MGAILIISIILAIAATVCAFLFIVPKNKVEGKHKVLQILHDIVNFKFLIIEKVLQATYILSTAFVIIFGFFMLFYVVDIGWYEHDYKWFGGYGILMMIFGPIAVRLAYELLMMLILAVKNIMEINSKLKNQNGNQNASIFDTEKNTAYYAPEAKKPVTYCTACGTPCDENGKCPNCGV